MPFADCIGVVAMQEKYLQQNQFSKGI
jgi:hypothetical protein